MFDLENIINNYDNNINIKEKIEKILGNFVVGSCIDETPELLLINSKKLAEHFDKKIKNCLLF